MSARRYSAAQALAAKLDLTEGHLKMRDGQDVYVCTRSVARSGMQRRVTVHVVSPGGILYEITRSVAKVTDLHLKDGLGSDAIVLDGAGMDMHWWLVDRLGTALGLDFVKRSI